MSRPTSILYTSVFLHSNFCLATLAIGYLAYDRVKLSYLLYSTNHFSVCQKIDTMCVMVRPIPRKPVLRLRVLSSESSLN
jgi:hypothetical protein